MVDNPKINLIRYADDFVVTGDSPETGAKAKEIVVEFLTERGLELSPRLQGLEAALAVGETQAPGQKPNVDQGPLLADLRLTDMDLRD